MSQTRGKALLAYIRERYGVEAMREVQDRFDGRLTIPPLRHWGTVALEADVLSDYHQAPRPIDLARFYEVEARKYQVHPKTVERALARVLKKKSAA